MTKKELLDNLKIIASMGDKQIETLANLLVDYYSTPDAKMGFKKAEEDAKV